MRVTTFCQLMGPALRKVSGEGVAKHSSKQACDDLPAPPGRGYFPPGVGLRGPARRSLPSSQPGPLAETSRAGPSLEEGPAPSVRVKWGGGCICSLPLQPPEGPTRGEVGRGMEYLGVLPLTTVLWAPR